MSAPTREELMKTCQNCRAEGCSCFHLPHDGKHRPGCERGKDKPEGSK